jgi:RNA polymerase sigma-70 factor, ECF subfamily
LWSDDVTEHFLTDLFERYHRAVFWYGLRHTRRPEDAEDLVQEVFYRVSRSARQYRRQGPGQETVWLFRIARNLLIDKQRKEPRPPSVEVPANHVGRDATQVLAFGLQEALDRIDAADREVFVLREVVGLTYEEIAAVCEMSEDGVRARLFRVRGQLRELLGGRVRSALKGKEGDRIS